MTQRIHILSFIFGTLFGVILVNGFLSFRPVFAEEKVEVKSVITAEELDKKLTEIVDSQAQFKAKIGEIKTQTHYLRLMSSQ
jgi:hypothetical protein